MFKRCFHTNNRRCCSTMAVQEHSQSFAKMFGADMWQFQLGSILGSCTPAVRRRLNNFDVQLACLSWILHTIKALFCRRLLKTYTVQYYNVVSFARICWEIQSERDRLVGVKDSASRNGEKWRCAAWNSWNAFCFFIRILTSEKNILITFLCFFRLGLTSLIFLLTALTVETLKSMRSCWSNFDASRISSLSRC